MNAAKQEYLEVADRIGNSLCRDAFWDTNRCTWMGWAVVSVNRTCPTVYRSLAADLYGGTSGIALFLAELYQLTNDRQQLQVLNGAVNQILSLCGSIQGAKRYGFYSGQAGMAYTLIRIGHLLRRENLIERGLSLIEGLCDVAPDSRYLDVVNGSAGTIPVLLALAKTYQRENFVELARLHGEHLLKCAEKGEAGWSWDTSHVEGQANLTGHSHGAAGIVTALLELSVATGEQDFQHAAIEGLLYEQQLFNSQERNWPDLRVMPQTRSIGDEKLPAYFMAWCHGAPGIGLSRLRNAELLPDNAAVKRDLEAAILATANSLIPAWDVGKGNYSLCHGAGGNAELMIMAGQRLNRPELGRIAEKVGQEGIEFYVKQGLLWPCGNPGKGETPNLMLGTAGIGHFYLRLYDPVTIPSVLIVTPDA